MSERYSTSRNNSWIISGYWVGILDYLSFNNSFEETAEFMETAADGFLP
jgi:hypothetical protein